MRAALLAMTLLTLPALAASPRFVSTPEGEVAVDLELDLATLPSFQWASDPFLRTSGLGRPRAGTPAPDEYKLQATTSEGEDPVAVVNDRVVRVGDRVGTRTVLKIGADFVLLGEKGSVIEATLEEPGAGEATRAPASTGKAPAKIESAVSAGTRQGSAAEALNQIMDGKISIEEVKK